MKAFYASRSDRIGQGALIDIFWRYRRVVLISTLVAVGCTAFYLLLARSQYTSSARLLVQNGALPLMPTDEHPASGGAVFLNNQRELMTSAQVLAIALASPGVAENKALAKISADRRLAYLKNEVNCEVGKNDDLITVSFTSPYPADSATIVTAIVDSYAAFQTAERKNAAKAALSIWEETHIERLRKLTDKQARLRELQDRYGVNNQQFDQEITSQTQLSRLMDILADARLETIRAKAAYDEAAKVLGDDVGRQAQVDVLLKAGAVSLLGVMDADAVKAQLRDIQKKRAEAQRKYLPTHPTLKGLVARQNDLENRYVASTKARWITARDREAAYQKSYEERQRQTIEMANRTAEFGRLMKEVKDIERESGVLENRINQISAVQAAGAISITVTSPATIPTEASSPHYMRSLLISLLVGLGSGVAIALVRDRAMAGLRNPAEIRMMLNLNVLGAVPAIDKSRTLAERGQTALEQASPAAEAYRSIRASIYTGLAKDRGKTLLITSAVPDEGKSTLSSNLGIVLAGSGLKTLIIDCDFRAPVQHRIFGVDDAIGFADVLAGEEDLDKAVRHTTIDNLDVLPAGSAAGNSAELVNQPLFVELLEQLVERYDHILIDSAAVMVVADARIIGSATDLTLLVIRPKKSGRKMVEMAKEGLFAVGANVIGAVVNSVSRENIRNFGGLGYFPFAHARRSSTMTEMAPKIVRRRSSSAASPPRRASGW